MRHNGILGALILLGMAGCATSTAPARGVPQLAGRERPLHARDLSASTSGEAEPPPTTWVHYHQMEVSYDATRGENEPMAPDGSRRLMLVAVPGCRCSESALDEFAAAPRPAEQGKALQGVPEGELPQVKTQWSGENLWVWVTDARPGLEYTIRVVCDPPEAMLSDPVASFSAGEFARYAISTPVREIKARLVRIESLRVPEVE